MSTGLHVVIDYQLERDFRMAAGKKFGIKKGNLKLSMEAALRMWLANQI